MIRKGLALFILLAFVGLLGGCETVKGAACGAYDGAKKDWANAQKVDVWIRKNLW